ncbi:MerR family transcriptional regulator [Paenibacillus humicola]|uniref:MerR family transcriptional regulator n=1 Tax=Paenibacillus humicola TaxID=3110540 RepID=UPI00237A2EA8|nr:MerR family transcriptional regulator [Paenibacillus humicola]
MRSEQEQSLTVGELARKCGVTVRTLQYYDKSGLLIPSGYSEGGRRMYSRRDIIRLQQILFLKSMGFSLREIKRKVLPADSTAELSQVFKHQRMLLAQQMAQLQQTITQLDKSMEELESDNEIGIERLLMITRASRADNPYSFLTRHISKEQIAYFMERFDEDGAADFYPKLQALTAKLMELYQRNEKPDGMEGQQLAEMWWSVVTRMTGKDLIFIRDMGAVIMNESSWPPEASDLKEATLSFLREAVLTYLRHNKITLPKEEARES